MKHLRRIGVGVWCAAGVSLGIGAPAVAADASQAATDSPLTFLAWWAVVSIVIGSGVTAIAMHRSFRAR